MRNLFLIALSLCISTFASLAFSQTCQMTADDKYKVLAVPQDQNGFDHNCDFTADKLQLNLYGIYLCENEPTPETYRENCSNVFFRSTPVVADIVKNGVSALGIGDVTMDEGEYNYAVVLVKPTVGVSFVNEYTHPLRGATGVGTTCWTNGVDIAISYNSPLDFSVECGNADDANPRVSNYTFSAIFDSNYLADPLGPFRREVLGIPRGEPINVYLLSDFEQRASVVPGANVFDQSQLQSNASLMLGVQKFDSPVNISGSTKNINFGFNITDTFFQKITGNSRYTENGQQVCGGNTGDSNNPINLPLTAGVGGAYACLATTYPTKFRFELDAR